MKVNHVFVAPGFCQDGCGRNGSIQAIALDHTGMRYGAVGVKIVAIDEYVGRPDVQLIKCQVHGPDGCMQDIDLVDLFMIHTGNSPGQGLMLYFGAQFIPQLRREFLGIIQVFVPVPHRQNDSGCIYGSDKTSAAGFITTSFKNICYQATLEQTGKCLRNQALERLLNKKTIHTRQIFIHL